jgi:hypothetical protein
LNVPETNNPLTSYTFVISSPGTQNAGTAFGGLTIQLQVNGVDTTNLNGSPYTGSTTIAFSGPGNSPNATAPSYPASVTFTNGLATLPAGVITLYKAQTTALTATDVAHGIAGTSTDFIVRSLNELSFTAGCPAYVKNSSYSSTVTRANVADTYGNNPWSSAVDLTFVSALPSGAAWSNPEASLSLAVSTAASATANAWTPPNGNYGNGQFSVSGGLYQPATCSFTTE